MEIVGVRELTAADGHDLGFQIYLYADLKRTEKYPYKLYEVDPVPKD